MNEKVPYRREPTELQVIKGKLRHAVRIATAATVVERFQDIPRLAGLTEQLTSDVKASLADLADYS